jgi:hypothetical protein
MEHGPLDLSPQQKSNSPDKFWEGFLGQKVTRVAGLLKDRGNITDPSVARALEESVSEVPKNRQEFVSKDEILLRALELYAQENNGFVNEKLEKGYTDTMAASLSNRLQSSDFDTAGELFQEEIDMILKDKRIPLQDSGVLALRDKFWEKFSALKAEEYEKAVGGEE